MPELTAAELARICSGTLHGDPAARAGTFSADSRLVAAGMGFVAVRGGHAFVAGALGAGAALAVVERPEALPAGATGVVVANVERALRALATEVASRLRAKVVAVTGSTGKTLTKDLLAAALRARFTVHATPGSFNNEVGMPLTVLGCPDEAEILVVELAARRAGQIAGLCEIVHPCVGVVTGVGVTHMGIFGSRAAIARTKAELLASLPADGTAVVPSSEDFLALLADSTAARVVSVGPGGKVRATEVSIDGAGRATATLWMGGGRTARVRVPVPGRALVRNAAMAMAVADELGVDASSAANAISALDPGDLSAWRMQVMEAGGRTIVNDAYSSNPASAAAALRAVWEMAGGRAMWAVLGQMAELGGVARQEHVRLGRLAAALGFERVIVVGEEARGIAEGAGGIAVLAADADEAVSVVIAHAPPDAVVLVKASRVAALEKAAMAMRTRPSLSGGPPERTGASGGEPPIHGMKTRPSLSGGPPERTGGSGGEPPIHGMKTRPSLSGGPPERTGVTS